MKVDKTIRPKGIGFESPTTLYRRKDIKIWESGRAHGYQEGIQAASQQIIQGILDDEPYITNYMRESLAAAKKAKEELL